MRYARPIVALLLWASSLSLQAVELRWNLAGIEKRSYHAAMEVDITGSFDKLEPERLISDSSEFDKVIARLKRLPLKNEYMHYRAYLKGLDSGRAIRVRMVGVPVEFAGEVVDEREAERRELVDLYTDIIRLQGDMDLTGDSSNLTFYRSPNERNLMTEYFYLPKEDVVVGDHWRLPVKFIELGPGFFRAGVGNAQSSDTHCRQALCPRCCSGVALSRQ